MASITKTKQRLERIPGVHAVSIQSYRGRKELVVSCRSRTGGRKSCSIPADNNHVSDLDVRPVLRNLIGQIAVQRFDAILFAERAVPDRELVGA